MMLRGKAGAPPSKPLAEKIKTMIEDSPKAKKWSKLLRNAEQSWLEECSTSAGDSTLPEESSMSSVDGRHRRHRNLPLRPLAEENTSEDAPTGTRVASPTSAQEDTPKDPPGPTGNSMGRGYDDDWNHWRKRVAARVAFWNKRQERAEWTDTEDILTPKQDYEGESSDDGGSTPRRTTAARVVGRVVGHPSGREVGHPSRKSDTQAGESSDQSGGSTEKRRKQSLINPHHTARKQPTREAPFRNCSSGRALSPVLSRADRLVSPSPQNFPQVGPAVPQHPASRQESGRLSSERKTTSSPPVRSSNRFVRRVDSVRESTRRTTNSPDCKSTNFPEETLSPERRETSPPRSSPRASFDAHQTLRRKSVLRSVKQRKASPPIRAISPVNLSKFGGERRNPSSEQTRCFPKVPEDEIRWITPAELAEFGMKSQGESFSLPHNRPEMDEEEVRWISPTDLSRLQVAQSEPEMLGKQRMPQWQRQVYADRARFLRSRSPRKDNEELADLRRKVEEQQFSSTYHAAALFEVCRYSQRSGSSE